MRAPIVVERIDAERHAMRRIEPKRLMPTGNADARAVHQHGMLEQQRLAATGLLHHAVGDLAHLEIRPTPAA